MSWPAKYDGDCSLCPEPIVEGDMMTTVNGRPAHADCSDESPPDSFASSPYRVGSGGPTSFGKKRGGSKQKICPKCGLEKPVNGDHKCWA